MNRSEKIYRDSTIGGGMSVIAGLAIVADGFNVEIPNAAVNIMNTTIQIENPRAAAVGAACISSAYLARSGYNFMRRLFERREKPEEIELQNAVETPRSVTTRVLENVVFSGAAFGFCYQGLKYGGDLSWTQAALSAAEVVGGGLGAGATFGTIIEMYGPKKRINHPTQRR